MGLAGGLPYVASAGTTVYLSHQAGLAAAGTLTNIDPGVALTILDQALNFQVTYGAVLLSFLGASLYRVHPSRVHLVAGALHWGMEFTGLGGFKGYPRLFLGVSPAVLAWSTITLQPTSALLCQWLGFTALWYADNQATAAGWSEPFRLISILSPELTFSLSTEMVFPIPLLLVYSRRHLHHWIVGGNIVLGPRCRSRSPFS